MVQEESIKEKFNDKAFVTFTTSASSNKLEGNHFNLLIIDEASQMKLTDLVYVARNCSCDFLVLCGDPA